jgi:uncharacterized protein (DUF433 family)
VTLLHRFLRSWRGGYYRLCSHRSHHLGLPCVRWWWYDGYCSKHLDTCFHACGPSRRGEAMTDRPHIIVDPAQNFGDPALGRSRVKVENLLERLDADDSWEDVADDHGLTRGDILVACWFEARYGSGPHPRDEWLDWLEAWEPNLWKASSVDYDEIPLPYDWTPEEEH